MTAGRRLTCQSRLPWARRRKRSRSRWPPRSRRHRERGRVDRASSLIDPSTFGAPIAAGMDRRQAAVRGIAVIHRPVRHGAARTGGDAVDAGEAKEAGAPVADGAEAGGVEDGAGLADPEQPGRGQGEQGELHVQARRLAVTPRSSMLHSASAKRLKFRCGRRSWPPEPGAWSSGPGAQRGEEHQDQGSDGQDTVQDDDRKREVPFRGRDRLPGQRQTGGGDMCGTRRASGPP